MRHIPKGGVVWYIGTTVNVERLKSLLQLAGYSICGRDDDGDVYIPCHKDSKMMRGKAFVIAIFKEGVIEYIENHLDVLRED